jgi:hypothetical protein
MTVRQSEGREDSREYGKIEIYLWNFKRTMEALFLFAMT